MASAYTPGLKVTPHMLVRKTRRLPLAGEVVVAKGDRVTAAQVVARTDLPGKVFPLNVANQLSITPDELGEAMRKQPGDPVKKDELLAETRSFFGLFHETARSPIDGTVESISSVTGQVILRAPPNPVEVRAYVDGVIVEVLPGEGVVLETEAAYVQGMRYEDIRAGLISFFPSPSLTPGRMNLLRVGRGHVLVDYAHNSAAMAGLMELVGRIDAARRIAVLAGPGDRRDEDLRALGRTAAGFDYAILKEDDDLRGREPGDVIELLRQGLVEAGMAPERIEVRPREHDAVARGLELLQEHDLLVILAVDVPAVLEQLRPVSTSL